MKNVYFISGLGIDERVFANLVLPEGFVMRPVRWVDPLKNESLPDYCRRLLAQIDTSQPVLLAGMSFGGVVSTELSRIIPVEKVILLSSIATSGELPRYYRLLIRMRLHKLLPATLLKRTNPLLYWFFGIRNKTARKLLKTVMRDMSVVFLPWAMERITRWENDTPPLHMHRIHGTSDRILYFPESEVEFPIAGAGHFMVYTHAEEVSRALAEVLGKSEVGSSKSEVEGR